MKLEAKYKAQMVELGIWQEAFAPSVHEMCMLEREIRRTRAAWKATAEDGKNPSPLDDHYTLIRQQSKDLQALRESLGLTPRGLRRLSPAFGAASKSDTEPAEITPLEMVRRRRAQ